MSEKKSPLEGPPEALKNMTPEKLEAKIKALHVYCNEHGCEAKYLGFEELEIMVRAHFGMSIPKLRRSL